VKPAPVLKPASNEERNARRALVLTQSPETRLVAVGLLPLTPHAMAGHLVTQVSLVRQLAAQPRTDATHEQLAKETGKLVALVASSQAVRQPSKVGVGKVVTIPQATARARLSVLQAQLGDLDKKERETLAAASKVGSEATRAALALQAKLLAAQKLEAAARVRLLGKGQDLNKPPRVQPSQVSKPRKPLTLPASFTPPGKSDIVTAVSILTSAVPPRPNETAAMRRIKIRGLLERVLARLVRKQMLVGKTPGSVQEAVEETVREDEAVIDAEVKETGGLAQDNAAQFFDPFIEEVAVEVDRSAVATAPVVVDVEPTASEVATALAVAEQEIAADVQAPYETWDAVREDLVQAEQVLPATPAWQKPRVWVGAAVLVSLGLLLSRGR
jgi:hypothetical protein